MSRQIRTQTVAGVRPHDRPSIGRDDFFEPPSLSERFLPKKLGDPEAYIYLKELCDEYKKHRDLDKLKEELSKDVGSQNSKGALPKAPTGPIHAVEPQFQAKKERTCFLLLGNCPQYQLNMKPILTRTTESVEPGDKHALTLILVEAISKALGGDVIGLGLRKDCWKRRDVSAEDEIAGCKSMDTKELFFWLWATKPELLVARIRPAIGPRGT